MIPPRDFARDEFSLFGRAWRKSNYADWKFIRHFGAFTGTVYCWNYYVTTCKICTTSGGWFFLRYWRYLQIKIANTVQYAWCIKNWDTSRILYCMSNFHLQITSIKRQTVIMLMETCTYKELRYKFPLAWLQFAVFVHGLQKEWGTNQIRLQ